MEGNLNGCGEKFNNLRFHVGIANRENKGAIDFTSECEEIHADDVLDFESQIGREVVDDFVVFFDTEDIVGPASLAKRSFFFG
jgi:hypothetical protein